MSFKVIGIGEVLWDLLPAGPQLGGAPANFAFHARQLGADVQVITRVGNDESGHQVLRRFSGMDIDTATVQVDQQLPSCNFGRSDAWIRLGVDSRMPMCLGAQGLRPRPNGARVT